MQCVACPPRLALLLLIFIAPHTLFDTPRYIEQVLTNLVVFAVKNFLETTYSVCNWHVLAFTSGKGLCHCHRLREEFLHLAGTGYSELIFVRQLINAQNSNDILQVFVALQDFLHATRGVVVFLTDDLSVEKAAGRGKRINGREDALFRDRTLKHDR